MDDDEPQDTRSQVERDMEEEGKKKRRPKYLKQLLERVKQYHQELMEREHWNIERNQMVAQAARQRRREDTTAATSDRHSDRRSGGAKDRHGVGDKRKLDDVKQERELPASNHPRGQDHQEPEKKKMRKCRVNDLPLMERPKAILDAPKRNDDSAVQSARERYLARKAQQAGAFKP